MMERMKKYCFFVMSLFFIACITQYVFANASIEKHEHNMHHHDEAQRPVLSGKVDENGIRIVEVKASRYKFEPDPIVVDLGDKVRLLITSTDVTHGLAISEFKVNVSVPAGETQIVEFIADKEGSFHMYCSVYCGPGHAHMHGTLVVQ
ncbi:MAG: cupredoxin domain-containing protein [Candidatus Omnitrophica bacterium]|nr:cupredoxin domain-containing protein [Candidatus Omnitrophota bacterium]